MANYIAQHGADWFPLLGLNLLRSLGELHRERWIFGDLKLENIIVGEYGEVDLIDFGGATPFGRESNSLQKSMIAAIGTRAQDLQMQPTTSSPSACYAYKCLLRASWPSCRRSCFHKLVQLSS